MVPACEQKAPVQFKICVRCVGRLIEEHDLLINRMREFMDRLEYDILPKLQAAGVLRDPAKQA